MKRLIITTLFSVLFAGCGIYSFKNTSLPSHIKTVDIPLMENHSLEPNIADEITSELNKEVIRRNLFKISSEKGDATITGKITGYENSPYTYGVSGTRNADVDQYAVKITAEIEFFDNKENVPIFKGTINGEGIYNFKTETELAGRSLAIKNVIQRLLESSMQSW
ncbi:MAG: hypothetical protein GX089_00810 [Fibrobacter sp.]|jgi:hypothetical protein|nr:hypothetical protein [Fibrobacter sp.]